MPTTTELSPDVHDNVVQRVHAERIDTTDRVQIRRAVARALAAEDVVLPPTQWARTVRDLVDGIAGFGALEPLRRDPRIVAIRAVADLPAVASYDDGTCAPVDIVMDGPQLRAAVGAATGQHTATVDVADDGWHVTATQSDRTVVVTLRRHAAAPPYDTLDESPDADTNMLLVGRPDADRDRATVRLVAALDGPVAVVNDRDGLADAARTPLPLSGPGSFVQARRHATPWIVTVDPDPATWQAIVETVSGRGGVIVVTDHLPSHLDTSLFTTLDGVSPSPVLSSYET